MGKKLLLALFALFVALPRTASADIAYSGSSTIGTGVLNAGAVAAFEKKSGKKFKSVEIPGSGKGIEALMAGKVELAGASRPLKAEERHSRKS